MKIVNLFEHYRLKSEADRKCIEDYLDHGFNFYQAEKMCKEDQNNEKRISE